MFGSDKPVFCILPDELDCAELASRWIGAGSPSRRAPSDTSSPPCACAGLRCPFRVGPCPLAAQLPEVSCKHRGVKSLILPRQPGSVLCRRAKRDDPVPPAVPAVRDEPHGAGLIGRYHDRRRDDPGMFMALDKLQRQVPRVLAFLEHPTSIPLQHW